MAAALRIAPNLASITQALDAITIAVRKLSQGAPMPDQYGLFERDVERDAHQGLDAIAPPRKSPGPVFIVYDFETTGLGKTNDIRIRQIGAKALNSNLAQVGVFSKFVNPGVPTSKGAKKVCNITPENEEIVMSMPAWDITGLEFYRWCEEMRDNRHDIPLYLIAHNGKRYDARILCFENQRHSITDWQFNKHSVDSIELFKELYPGQSTYRLGDLYRSVIGFELKDAHDAMADVQGVVELMAQSDTDDVVKAVLCHSESFNAVLKRCMS